MSSVLRTTVIIRENLCSTIKIVAYIFSFVSTDIPLMEKKYSLKDVDKCTDDLADMNQAVVTVQGKGLDQFEGQ